MKPDCNFFHGLKIFVLAVTCLFTPNVSFADAGKNFALLIGITDYQQNPLSNPINDVQAVSDALQSRGWTTVVLQNPDASDARNAILKLANISRGLGNDSAVMVYFSGHGFQIDSDSYIYFDGPSSDIRTVIEHSLSISDILSAFGESENAAKLILIDACRSNPFGEVMVTSASAGLTQIEAPSNSVIAFATAPYRVAYDDGIDTNGLGPYASSVVAALDSSQNSDEFFRSVRRDTIIATDGEQVPWETSSLLQNVNLGPIGSAPLQTEGTPFPSLLTEQTVELTAINRQPADSDDFASQVAVFLENGVRSADLRDIVVCGDRPATEQDREDYIATIRNDLATSDPATFLGNYGESLLNDMFGLNPACRSNDGLDFNCMDTDRKLYLPLNPEFAYQINKAAYDLGGRTDGLAMMYRDGIFVAQSYVKAYDVYLEARGRSIGDRRYDEYFEVDINTMTQVMLNKLGAGLNEDGDFGTGSCAALRKLVPGDGCGRIPSRKDIELLGALVSRPG